MTEPPAPPRGPRPIAAFFLSLAGSCFVLGLLLLSDRRVLELRKARAEIRQRDQQIAERRRENEELRSAIEAASRHAFPAEKAAREELHLVRPDDLVIVYPPGSLSAKGRAPTPVADRTGEAPATPSPR